MKVLTLWVQRTDLPPSAAPSSAASSWRLLDVRVSADFDKDPSTTTFLHTVAVQGDPEPGPGYRPGELPTPPRARPHQPRGPVDDLIGADHNPVDGGDDRVTTG